MKKYSIFIIYFLYISNAYSIDQNKKVATITESLAKFQDWSSSQIKHQDATTILYTRASTEDRLKAASLVFDYRPQYSCQLSHSAILIHSDQLQPQRLALTIYGKMQIDDQAVQSIEAQVNSAQGDQFITLKIDRPRFDEELFKGKTVMFHFSNYGFFSFSLAGYGDSMRKVIPECRRFNAALGSSDAVYVMKV